MIKHARAIGLGLFVAVAVAALLGPSASAYIGQNPYVLELTGPATAVDCANDALLTVSVISVATGQPVDHQVVLWDIKRSPSPDDRLSDSRTQTGADGKSSVTLTFASVGGQRTIRATVATFGIDVLVTCNGPAASNPPSPSSSPPPTRPPASPPPSSPPSSTGPGVTPTPTAVPSATPTAVPTATATSAPVTSATPSGGSLPTASTGVVGGSATPSPAEVGPGAVGPAVPPSGSPASGGIDLIVLVPLLLVGAAAGLMAFRRMRRAPANAR